MAVACSNLAFGPYSSAARARLGLETYWSTSSNDQCFHRASDASGSVADSRLRLESVGPCFCWAPRTGTSTTR